MKIRAILSFAACVAAYENAEIDVGNPLRKRSADFSADYESIPYGGDSSGSYVSSVSGYGEYASYHAEPQVISHHTEVHQPVPVPIYKTLTVAVPHPVAVPYPQPVAVKVPVPYPVVKQVTVEKPVPYPVDKPYPVHIEKKVPVYKPYPVPVPVYKIKHIYHTPKIHKYYHKW